MSSLSKLLTLAVLCLGAGLVLLPLAVVFLTSLAPPGASLSEALSQKALTWANYREAWHRGNFPLAFANSTSIALAVTALQILTSALAGYALARLRFRGREAVLWAIVATLIVPFQILVVPIFLVLKWGHLLNTYGALILPVAANGYGIFLLRQYFSTIPVELEEAALLDGASRWQVLWRISLPLARPALIALFLLTFIGEWNDLFKPLVFTTRPELRTVQLSLAALQEEFTSSWSVLMAAVTLSTVPVIAVFLMGQRQFVRGIGTTGIKN